MARDHYREFDHPVLRDIPETPPSDFLSEMDVVADECRASPKFFEGDLEIAFRDLQKRRRPHLTAPEFADLFAEWSERYAARDAARAADVSARRAQLWSERDALFEQRVNAPPSEHAAITARIAAVVQEIAALTPVPRNGLLDLITVRTD